MKPYLAFYYEFYYPRGGLNDLVGAFATFAEAEAALTAKGGNVQQIVNMTDGSLVERVNIDWSDKYGEWKPEPLAALTQ